MELKTHKPFSPFYDLPKMVEADQIALASQMHLCRSEPESWHRFRFLLAQAQAYSARHVVSVLLLLGASSRVATWLIG